LPAFEVTAAVCAPLFAQLIVNHEPVGLTGSEKLTVMFAPVPTSDVPLAGVVDATVGGGSVVPRGLGAPAVKSAELLFVSVAPPLARESEVVFVNPGAGEVSKQFAVLP
jgi:hypothetical protein